jgi:hypothetical protein
MKKLMLALILVLLIISMIYMRLASNQKNVGNIQRQLLPTVSITPIPTRIAYIHETVPNPSQTAPANEMPPTDREKSLGELLVEVPIQEDGFVINYDFAKKKFTVESMVDTGMALFTAWRRGRYPALNDDDFIILD